MEEDTPICDLNDDWEDHILFPEVESTVIDDQEKEEAPTKIHVSTSAMKGAWSTLREGFQERGNFLELIGVIDDFRYQQSVVQGKQSTLLDFYTSAPAPKPKILAELDVPQPEVIEILVEGSNLSTSSSELTLLTIPPDICAILRRLE